MTKYEQHDHLVVEIARRYSEEYHEPFLVSVGDSSAWDMCALSGKPAIEVKAETTPARTGNVVIEYWNSDLDKPSGILATSADIWVHLVPDGDGLLAIEYDVETLRKAVVEAPVSKNNGRNSVFKVIPLDDFRRMAKRTFTFSSEFMVVNPAAGPERRAIGDF